MKWIQFCIFPVVALGMARGDDSKVAFETIKLKNAWACHYAYNSFDGNMLIGDWPGQPENFLMATGFSGHGLQHAPAAGRAMAELILDGRFVSIDLNRFHARRVAEGRREPEQGTKA